LGWKLVLTDDDERRCMEFVRNNLAAEEYVQMLCKHNGKQRRSMVVLIKIILRIPMTIVDSVRELLIL
jgi:hypothetical protein